MQAEAKAVGESAIASVGAYAPLLRLDRDSAAKALKFSGLGGRGGGRRAVAGWDEDPLTLGSRGGADHPSGARHGGVRVHVRSLLRAASRGAHCGRARATSGNASAGRFGLAALRRLGVARRAAWRAGPRSSRPVKGGRAAPGSPLHLSQGDGGSAVMVAEDGAARLIGWASLSHDLVDIYASREHPEPYAYEERFVRETALSAIFAPTIRNALAMAGLGPSDIQHAAVHEPARGPVARHRPRDRDRGPEPCVRRGGGAWRSWRRPWPVRVCARIRARQTGRAHSARRIRKRLRRARAGNDGADAGRRIGGRRAPPGVAFGDYVRFLSLNGALELDWGVRSEFEQKAQATVIARTGAT